MKLTTKKSDLLPVLAKIQGLTGRKTNLVITTNLLIKTTDSGISISGTDLETGFEGLYPANVEAQGSIAINARKFYEIVRDFPSEDIDLKEIENHWIEIGNEHVEYHIVGMNPDDFPEIPKIEAVEFFEIDSIALAKMIEKTVIVSGASDDKRAHIIGVYAERIIEEKRRIFRLVSTDGSRLSKVDYFYDKDYNLPSGTGVIIPKKGLVEVNKFLESEGPAQVGFKENNLIIKKNRETLIIRLLEGAFPAYDDIIEKSGGNDIFLDRQLFLMMLKRMSILSSEDYKGVIFNFSKDKLVINSTNPDIGESKEDMIIEFSGEPITVMFNPKFFIDTLSVMSDDNVIINIVNEEKPCLIAGEKDKTYLSVIMPMRI
ncbi:MAG: DNA polymerase III subunit beta [Desulfobacterales bacterium]|nr:MAG: DNA polymerase III subunit beta [Desulfobacterales bacterium]